MSYTHPQHRHRTDPVPFQHLQIRRLIRAGVTSALMAGLGGGAHAATCTWIGATNSMQSTANWTCSGGAAAPATGDTLFFPAGATTKTPLVNFSPVPNFTDITFEEGYVIDPASPALLSWTGTLSATAFDGRVVNGNGSGHIDIYGSASGPTYIGDVRNVATIALPPTGDASGQTATLSFDGTMGTPNITVNNHGRLFLSSSTSLAGDVIVQPGGTLAIGGTHPKAGLPFTQSGGSATAVTFRTGATLEYRLLPLTYETHAIDVNGVLTLDAATLTMVLDTPGADVPANTELVVMRYDSLNDHFVGLSEGAHVAPIGAPSQLFRLSYGPDAGYGAITLTRLPAPGADAPPVLQPISDVQGVVGQPIAMNMMSYVTLTGGDPITASDCYLFGGLQYIEDIFAGLSYNYATHTIEGTPTAPAAGLVSCSFYDKDGKSNGRTFTLSVTAAPTGPAAVTMPVPSLGASAVAALSCLLAGLAALRRRQ